MFKPSHLKNKNRIYEAFVFCGEVGRDLFGQLCENDIKL